MLSLTRPELPLALAAYQDSIWPAQPLAYALAALALVALVRREPVYQRLALGILALLWGWTAIAYHWLFLDETDRAALLFGMLFAAQACMLGFLAVRRSPPPSFAFSRTPEGVTGMSLVVFALVIYPALDFLLLAWPRMPWLGIPPGPVTLFTLGYLLLASPRLGIIHWLVPIGWALLAGISAVILGIVQDWALVAGGAAALILLLPGSNRGALRDSTQCARSRTPSE